MATLDPANLAAVEGLKSVTASDLEKNSLFTVPPSFQRRRAAPFTLALAQSHLAGDVRLDQDGILILQPPFSSGWHAVQDGRPVPALRADFGLLGLPVKAGEHRVELRYRNPWLLTGAVITGLSALLLAILLWRKPRLAVSLA